MNRMSSTEGLQRAAETDLICYHCGDDCVDASIRLGEKIFCCQGCKTVYEILNANELCNYYDLDQTPGNSPRESVVPDRFTYLDDPGIKASLVEFSDGQKERIRLQIPGMHCSSCIWLLEKLHELDRRIQRSEVNFPRKELTVHYDPGAMQLSELVAMLASLGYEPLIRLDTTDHHETTRAQRQLWIKIGIAGFAFGNVMLLSFPEYLSRISEVDPVFKKIFGILSLLISLPVLLYSATDYFRSAWAGLRQKQVNIDVPISLGVGILFLRSAWEILSSSGAGYLDSFNGLVFFLLIGRVFQQKTYDVLSFERDYRAYFPLAVTRRIDGEDIPLPVSDIQPGDRILVRNQELIPADSVLLKSTALIDYSFVTGESDPVPKKEGDFLYAGGRQLGTSIELEVLKEPSQGYLTSLWNNEIFQKPRLSGITNLANRFSRWFTLVVLLLATAAGAYWLMEDPSIAVRVFTAVLIVACPCALALASPFALGTAMRFMGRRGVYFKNTESIEALAAIDTIVLDKTGTLTETTRDQVLFEGSPLSVEEQAAIRSLVRHSTHPLSQKIEAIFHEQEPVPVEAFREVPGEGLEGTVSEKILRLGSAAWVGRQGQEGEDMEGSTRVFVQIDGERKGAFLFKAQYRKGVRDLIRDLGDTHNLELISGDTPRERASLMSLFDHEDRLHFEQSPQDKLDFVEGLKASGHHVLMIGDGLNDAGALQASEVGIAVTDDVNTFSPASDAIIQGRELTRLGVYLQFAAKTRQVIMASFILSLLYNVVGLGFAVSGLLSPLVSAILMPASSISIVAFTTFFTTLAARHFGLLEGK